MKMFCLQYFALFMTRKIEGGGGGSPSSLALLLFGIILNSEYQNNEFNNPE